MAKSLNLYGVFYQNMSILNNTSSAAKNKPWWYKKDTKIENTGLDFFVTLAKSLSFLGLCFLICKTRSLTLNPVGL